MMEFLKGIIMETVETLLAMSPYLLFGFLIAGVLSVIIKPETVERHLGGKGLLQVIKASLFGVPLPLCSCGVIPVSASLRKSGAGKGATTSFLISTPQTGVDSIFVTLSLLGPVYAVFRPIVAFVSGILGGTAVNILDGDDPGRKAHDPETCEGACCVPSSTKSKLRDMITYGFYTLPKDINRALIIGILIAGFISAMVPDDFFAGILGGGILAMLVMVALGVPVYVCATASVPIAAALIMKGVSPGAALVFLMTGPATNAATILTVARVMGRRTAVIYLLTVVFSAIGAGLLLDSIYSSMSVQPAASMPMMFPGWLRVSSVILLLAVIGGSFYNRREGFGKHTHRNVSPEEKGDEGIGSFDPTAAGVERLEMAVEGMHCTHCSESVKRNLEKVRGVASVRVDLKKGKAWIEGKDLDRSVLAGEVEALGYRAGWKPGE